MTNNPKFTVQLLDKIGGPLAVAIDSVLPTGDDIEIEAAKIMAQLLGQVTQVSTKLYNTLEIKEDEEQADSTRLALAALVAPLIAESYKYNKQVPAEDNISRIGKSLEALISFGENFSPAAGDQSRLQTIDHDAILFDKDQPSLVVLQAMVPVINAVDAFPFGQSKTKLVQDIAARLEKDSVEISKKTGDGDKYRDKLRELIIFKSLAALYTSCHLAETLRASSANDVELSLDPVWDAFTTKVAMIEALMGGEGKDSDNVDAPEPAQEPVQKSEPEAEVLKKEEDSEPQKEGSSSSAGPMGFFKKDDNDSGGEDKPAVEEVKAEAAETSKPDTEVNDSGDEAPSGPMGFFKPGAQKKEDSEA